jgi:hypothetical protein
VTVACEGVPRIAPVGERRETRNVSSGSTSASSLISTFSVFWVSPGPKRSLPSVRL